MILFLARLETNSNSTSLQRFGSLSRNLMGYFKGIPTNLEYNVICLKEIQFQQIQGSNPAKGIFCTVNYPSSRAVWVFKDGFINDSHFKCFCVRIQINVGNTILGSRHSNQ
jgi:hypothetical protein